jgi:DNA invertase Pin-like site-specific DNA recombinase
VVSTYTDVTSGARDGRPEFRRLLADAPEGKFDVVIVQRLTHLARSLKQLIATLEHLHRAGVGVVSLMEDVDTTIPEGDLVFRGIIATGRFERALTGDRIRTGLERARALGAHLGRPAAPVAPDQVRAFRASGLTFREIGRRLGISPALAHRLTQEPPPEARPGRSENSETSL